MKASVLTSRFAKVGFFLSTAVVVERVAVLGGAGFLLTQLTMSAYYSLVALGLSLLMGYAGQISLGHAGFFAIGGYTSAVLTTWDLSARRGEEIVAVLARAGLLVTRAGAFGGEVLVLHPWPAFLCAVSLSAAVAFVVGIPVLKLKGHYLAMATLGVGTILSSIAVGTAALGAADGISGVPPFDLLPGLRVAGNSSVRVANYYVAYGLLAAGMLLLSNLVHSRVGRALRAIHGAEDAASAMGVDIARYKLGTFVLSAALAAVAGSLLTHFNAGIGPSEVSIMKSVRYVAIVAVGGMGSLWGALAASVVLNFLSLRGYFGSLDDAVFGAILIAVMLFAPGGILSLDVRGAIGAVLRRLRPARAAARAPGEARPGEDGVPVIGGEAGEEGR
ncbi:MAG TPA: branched-chain amino acid ABC transporter permease [Anaeromyxobacter sp.]